MEKPKLYEVTKSWGSRRVGEILPESREVRRKLQEGGCLIEYNGSTPEVKPSPEIEKKMESEPENKMASGEKAKNKGVK